MNLGRGKRLFAPTRDVAVLIHACIQQCRTASYRSTAAFLNAIAAKPFTSTKAQIKSIPEENTMQVHPYLVFDGTCEAAFKFYHQVLGGELGDMMTFAGSPAEEEVPPELGNKIMHTQLTFGDWGIMGSDCMPGQYETPQGFSVSLQISDPAEAERIFNALAEGGKIQMPLAETFWAKRFGMAIDKFGTPWMVNCD